MPVIDLAGTKSQLTASLGNLSSLSENFTKLSSGVISGITPELKSLANVIPNMVASTTRAIASMGTSIIGESLSALPKMQDMVENMIPNTAELKDLCEAAAKKIEGGAIPAPPGLLEVVNKLKEEGSKIGEIAKSVSAQLTSNTHTGPDSFQTLITEMDTISTTLATYANEVGSHLFNPTGPMPHFSQLTDNIKMDQLLDTANTIKNSALDLSSGAVTSTLYKAAGILRETTLRSFNKSYLYQKAELELGKISEELTSEVAKEINRTKNATPEQNTGI